MGDTLCEDDGTKTDSKLQHSLMDLAHWSLRSLQEGARPKLSQAEPPICFSHASSRFGHHAWAVPQEPLAWAREQQTSWQWFSGTLGTPSSYSKLRHDVRGELTAQIQGSGPFCHEAVKLLVGLCPHDLCQKLSETPNHRSHVFELDTHRTDVANNAREE